MKAKTKVTVAQGAKVTKSEKKGKDTKVSAKSNSNVIETLVKKEQRFLYRFQIGKEKLAANKAKQRRQKIRRQLDGFDAAIRMEKNAEKRTKAIEDFKAFYKQEFILNDFSVKSLTDSREQYKIDSYSDMLKLVQSTLKASK